MKGIVMIYRAIVFLVLSLGCLQNNYAAEHDPLAELAKLAAEEADSPIAVLAKHAAKDADSSKTQIFAKLNEIAARVEVCWNMDTIEKCIIYYRKNPIQDLYTAIEKLIIQISAADAQEILASAVWKKITEKSENIADALEDFIDRDPRGKAVSPADLDFLNIEIMASLAEIYEQLYMKAHNLKDRSTISQNFSKKFTIANDKISALRKLALAKVPGGSSGGLKMPAKNVPAVAQHEMKPAEIITFSAPSVKSSISAPATSKSTLKSAPPAPLILSAPLDRSARAKACPKVKIPDIPAEAVSKGSLPKTPPYVVRNLPKINTDLQRWAAMHYGQILPVGLKDFTDFVVRLESVQQSAAECGYYSAIHAWAIQQLINENQHITAEAIRKKSEENRALLNYSGCDAAQLKRDTSSLGLKNTYIVTFDENFPDDIGPEERIGIQGANDLDEFLDQFKRGARDIGYLITNFAEKRGGGHWILIVVRNSPYKHILWIDSKNFYLAGFPIFRKFLETLRKKIVPEQTAATVGKAILSVPSTIHTAASTLNQAENKHKLTARDRRLRKRRVMA